MTLDQVLELATFLRTDDTVIVVGGLTWLRSEVIAAIPSMIVDLLGVALPCGYESPIAEDGEVVLPEGAYTFGQLSPEDARGLAAALLRTADEAEAQSTSGGVT